MWIREYSSKSNKLNKNTLAFNKKEKYLKAIETMAPYQPLGMELEFHFSEDQDKIIIIIIIIIKNKSPFKNEIYTKNQD